MSYPDAFAADNGPAVGPWPWDHPLRDLLPEDRDHGWPVARNPLKPLNHREFLREKEAIAVELGLHSLLTPPELFDANYALLAAHQAREMSTVAVIRNLARQSRRTGASLSEGELRRRLRAYATVRHMEFHPSDVCNLKCCGCTYGQDDPAHKPPPVSFPFDAIREIARLQPKSMVIIGGGEPTLYRSGEHRFQQLVEQVHAVNPGIVLALVTNGTYKPAGDWPDRFSWIRVSLDAATGSTYTAFRGRPMFDRVLQNYLSYLDHGVKHVGIGFLFARSNIHEYAAVARLIFDLVKAYRPEALSKVNIQYRPLRQDPREYGEPFAEAITAEQIGETVRELQEMAASSNEIRKFLRNQTNVTAVLGGNTHPPHAFARCYYSETFKIVRANGDLRPCFIRVVEPDFDLGSIISGDLETIGLNTLYIAARRKLHCDGVGCGLSHVNYIFEQGLRGHLTPSSSAEVRQDPMY